MHMMEISTLKPGDYITSVPFRVCGNKARDTSNRGTIQGEALGVKKGTVKVLLDSGVSCIIFSLRIRCLFVSESDEENNLIISFRH